MFSYRYQLHLYRNLETRRLVLNPCVVHIIFIFITFFYNYNIMHILGMIDELRIVYNNTADFFQMGIPCKSVMILNIK